MVPIRAGDIVAAVGGRLVAGDPEAIVSSISVDSRRLKPGDLFIPLKGANFDGHQFIDEAIEAGAGGFFTEHVSGTVGSLVKSKKSGLAIKVDDTQTALNKLAHLIRERLTAHVIGITGSTGKTSTKDILASITQGSFETLASLKNNNNEIGAPLTITKADSETRVLVIEMGMRGLGQIASLAAIAEPEIGIVTNIGLTHMGALGSQKNIAEAKSELIQALPAAGYAILNNDDGWTDHLRKKTKARVVTFGFGPDADYSATDITFDDLACPSWRLVVSGKPGPMVTLSIPGRHNVANALGAIAAAKLIGVDERAIIDRLRRVRLTEMRFHLIRTQEGTTIVNDVYNANPASMAGALETLVKIKTSGRHIAVLGQMSELGKMGVEAHKNIGQKVAKLPVDMLVAVGEQTKDIADSAVGGGLPKTSVTWWKSNQEAADWLKSHILPGDAVLVKGSRVAGLEFIVDELTQEK